MGHFFGCATDGVDYVLVVIADADIVTAHNGDRFDLTVFNTRLLAHGLDPIPPTKSLDTKKIAKNKFHLPSNKLNDIADFLGIGKKLSTTKDLWMGCEKGDEKAWRYMKRYCAQDVILQDTVLGYIIPFIKHVHNYNAITGEQHRCPNPTCGSNNLQRRGFNISSAGRYQRYQCIDCGTWSSDRGEKSIIR